MFHQNKEYNILSHPLKSLNVLFIYFGFSGVKQMRYLYVHCACILNVSIYIKKSDISFFFKFIPGDLKREKI